MSPSTIGNVHVSSFQSGGSVSALNSSSGFQPAPAFPALNPSAGEGQVVFASAAPALLVFCDLDDGSATFGGGVGGWQQVDRPHRQAFPEWQGTGLATLSIPILLDGLVARESQEGTISDLLKLGSPVNPEGEPPVLAVGGMVPHNGRYWVMDTIDWGEATWAGMVRVRQHAVVNLLEFVSSDVVEENPAPKKQPASKGYTVKKGDTLTSVAKAQMGAKTAKEVSSAVAKLKEANSIRDPTKLTVGSTLKIPGSFHDSSTLTSSRTNF